MAAIELTRVRIPLVRPHVYAGGEEHERDVVLVRAIDRDGAEGWGECSALASPGYTAETTATAWQELRDELAPMWLAGVELPRASPMAFASLQCAAFDLTLRRQGDALVDVLAGHLGERRSAVEWCAVLSMHASTAILDEVDRAVAAGASQVKLKIGPGHDVADLRAVRDRHADLPLAADANGSYPSPGAIPDELAQLGLMYLEQPLAADDLRGSAEVAATLGLAVALDESITSAARLEEAVTVGACSIVSVKPARLGGLDESVGVLALAQQLGVGAFVGGMLETGIGRAVALALAAQAPCSLPTDVGPTARYFVEDVTAAFAPDAQGRLRPPVGPGIGVVPDPDAIDRHRIDRVSLRP